MYSAAAKTGEKPPHRFQPPALRVMTAAGHNYRLISTSNVSKQCRRRRSEREAARERGIMWAELLCRGRHLPELNTLIEELSDGARRLSFAFPPPESACVQITLRIYKDRGAPPSQRWGWRGSPFVTGPASFSGGGYVHFSNSGVKF